MKASDLLGEVIHTHPVPAPPPDPTAPHPRPAVDPWATRPVTCWGCAATFDLPNVSRYLVCGQCSRRDGKLGPDAMQWIHDSADQPAAYRAALLRRKPEARPVAHVTMPAIFRDATPIAAVREWAIGDAGARALVLIGEVGRGKSYQACAALRLLAERDPFGGFELASAVRLGRPGDRLDVLRDLAGVGLDDLGAKLTPGALAAAYEIIDHRTANRLPLIVTSNLDLGEVQRIDARIASRLAGGLVLLLDGPDRRVAP